MRLFYYLRRALTLPPRQTIRIASRMAREILVQDVKRLRDPFLPTFGRPLDRPGEPLIRSGPSPQVLAPHAAALDTLARRTLAHEFDLLGSGPVRVAHGVSCRGIEGIVFPPGPVVTPDPDGRWLAGRINPANLPESRRIWRLISPDYAPIDWQLDFKSGYRWDERTWYKDIGYGQVRGADVKVPWELARMQHLPRLALAFALAGAETGQRLAREFRDQVLDFTAQNPPRFGVNWSCAMDVAIRAANLVLAFDLFAAYGATFDPDFTRVFTRTLADHAAHVAGNLEYSETLRANHYLCDLAGLLFAAARLAPDRQALAWFDFAWKELLAEGLLQFHPDGSNFEASTSYHRLSLETMLHCLALGLGRGRNVPEELAGRMRRAARFSRDTAGTDGRIIQIGDNDNGRFFNLIPRPAPEGGEDFLNHAHLTAAASGIIADPMSPIPAPSGDAVDAAMTALLAGGRRFSSDPSPEPGHASGNAVRLAAYPDFGLYLFWTADYRLSFRCGSIGQNGNGGHAHNDQLAITFEAHGRPVLIDPGTFVYTPLAEARNHFRATAAHNTLAAPGLEQNPFVPETLFALKDAAKAEVLEISANRALAGHKGFGVPCRRGIDLGTNYVTISDACAIPGVYLALHLDPATSCQVIPGGADIRAGDVLVRLRGPGRWRIMDGEASPGYGLKRPAPVLVIEDFGERLDWSIEL